MINDFYGALSARIGDSSPALKMNYRSFLQQENTAKIELLRIYINKCTEDKERHPTLKVVNFEVL